MYQDQKIFFAKSGDEKIYIYPKMANRHGLIAGATGTGKTVTLKVLAESFSDSGVPVFLADVKGDLAGMCQGGVISDSLQERIDALGLGEDGFHFHSYPTNFWDIYAEKGMPLRTTISEMGPLLLARMLELNDVQTDILTVVFKIADDEGLLLMDTKDLKAMLAYVSENAKEYAMNYGNIAPQSVAAIVRAIVALEAEGGEMFFGEPALSIGDWMCTDCDGKGNIQILDCQKLINNPTMYSTFMLWLLSELFEVLPEAGDREKPKMVFFFDEAHLLFDNASKNLLNKIEQVVKLIRSKGVGIYFITQTPKDIPDGVLGQLGNKIQHALHAYTPAELKSAKTAADSFRPNPEFDTFEVLTSLGIGEALVSVLDEAGVPTVVQKCKILPPLSQMGPIDDSIRENLVKGGLLYAKYSQTFDRESAYEILGQRVEEAMEAAAAKQEEIKRQKEEADAIKAQMKAEAEAEKQRLKEEAAAQKQKEREEAAAQKAAEKEALAAQRAAEKEALAAQKAAEKEELAKKREEEKKEAAKKRAVKNVASSVTGTVGREIGNELGKKVGGTFGKKVGGNLGAALGRGVLSTLFK